MIIGTAGHIDHGKTSLVKALTGVDADRLPEEKARGITIDLGFAYAPTEQGSIVGFVDVPGHEKFVHTMAAGASGVDHGLLVIAADDGVMPQTREHLRILDLLGVPQISVAVTKTDLVDEARKAQLEVELKEFFDASRYTLPKTYWVSTKTNQGIGELKKDLFSLQESLTLRRPEYFRLAIDRVFVVKGMGVAITGSVLSGAVHVGDSLILAPAGREVKVRSIHAQNQPSQSAQVGMRCGIVIAGVELSDVDRGNWLLSPMVHTQTQRFDCQIRMPHDAEKSIKDGELVLLHHGTQLLTTRMILLNQSEVMPGQVVYAQCAVHQPIHIGWHDRVVIRDSSARHTLAGGLVLDIDPPLRGRKKIERIHVLDDLVLDDPVMILSKALEQSEELIPFTHWAKAMNCSPAQLKNDLASSVALEIEYGGASYWYGVKGLESYVEKISSALARFHEMEPDEPGVAIERLRRMALPGMAPELFKLCLSTQIQRKVVALTGSFVHLPEHRVELSEKEQIMWERIYPKLMEGSFDPPWVRDLASLLQEPEASVRMLLRKVSRTSSLVQLVPDLFYPVDTMRIMADMIREVIEQDGFVTVISFKNRVNLGRKRAIQILEAFDRLGFTRRLVSYKRSKKELEKDHRIIRNHELFSIEKDE